MSYEINFVINLSYLAYLLIGFGVGYLVVLGVTGGPDTSLDRKKHDLEVKKEWFRMLAEQKKEQEKKARWDRALR